MEGGLRICSSCDGKADSGMGFYDRDNCYYDKFYELLMVITGVDRI